MVRVQTQGKRYNIVGAETPKLQYSSARRARELCKSGNGEKFIPEMKFVIC